MDYICKQPDFGIYVSKKIRLFVKYGGNPLYISCVICNHTRFLNMDFSLFKTITQRVSVLNNNPPAMRVETICYTKKSPIRYNIVVQATIVRKDGDFNG